MRRRELASRLLFGGALGVVALVAWEAAALVWPDRFALVGRPSSVAPSLADYYWGDDEPIYRHALLTLEEVAAGMVVGISVGLVTAIALYASPVVRRLVNPPLITLNAIPHIALAPLSILWFGFGLTGKVVIVAVILVPLVTLNMYGAMRAIVPEWIAHARVLGAGGARLIPLVLLPASLPTLLATVRYAVGNSFRLVIFAEFIGSSGGLGYLLIKYGNQVDMKGLFAVVLVVIGLSVLLDAVALAVQGASTKWQVA